MSRGASVLFVSTLNIKFVDMFPFLLYDHCREKDLQAQVTSLRSQLKDLYSSNESTQAKLVDASQRQDQDTLAKLAELDIVVEDLARANERVASVQRRNELLRSEIESVRSGSEESKSECRTHGHVRAMTVQGMTANTCDVWIATQD